MALELKIGPEDSNSDLTVSADCLTYTIHNITGDYDADNNPTGYGTPNPDQEDLGYALRVLKKVKNEDDQVITVDNTNPAATSWEVDVASDGYYYNTLYGALLYDEASTYSLNQIVMYAGVFYKALGSIDAGVYPGTDATKWEVIQPQDEEDNASLYVSTYNYVHSCVAETCYSKVVSQVARDNCECMNKDLQREFVRMDVKLQAAFVDYYGQNYEEAAELLDSLAAICTDLYDCGCS